MLATAAGLMLAPSSSAHANVQRQTRIAGDGALAAGPAARAPRSNTARREVRVAGECTTVWKKKKKIQICGQITNRDPREKLMITNDWGQYKDSRTWAIVKPGKTGHAAVRLGTGRPTRVKDVDGFYVGTGCKAKLGWLRWIGPGWYKIYDGQYVVVSDIRCSRGG
jgi:hypothetical protein